MSLNQPLPTSDIRIVVPNATPATIMAVDWGSSQMEPSPARPMAMCTETGARMRPMSMITGPVTTGGSSRCMNSTPKARMSRLMTM